jgi:DNA polymerase I-like protein with 3'-5' exonuclease and polymerase domains
MKFDWVLLDRRGICMRPYDDSLVMSFNLDAGGLASHAMDDLARKHLDHQCLTYKEVCGSGQKQIKFNEVPAAPRHRICRRGCRRHLAAVEALQGAAGAGAGGAGL